MFELDYKVLEEQMVNFIEAPEGIYEVKSKYWAEMILHKQRTTGKVGCFQMYIDYFYYKRTKLLQSKSKQRRIVSVVCK
jgi:hypothetical protein